MRKYLGAIISGAVTVAVIVLYWAFILRVAGGADVNALRVLRLIAGVIILFVGGGITFALVQRVQELNRGQEDDLGKY